MTCVILCIVWFATKYFESERIRLIRREVWTVHFVAKSLARRVADGSLELASQSGKVLCDDVPVPCTFTQSDFVWDFRTQSFFLRIREKSRVMASGSL